MLHVEQFDRARTERFHVSVWEVVRTDEMKKQNEFSFAKRRCSTWNKLAWRTKCSTWNIFDKGRNIPRGIIVENISNGDAVRNGADVNCKAGAANPT